MNKELIDAVNQMNGFKYKGKHITYTAHQIKTRVSSTWRVFTINEKSQSWVFPFNSIEDVLKYMATEEGYSDVEAFSNHLLKTLK